MGRIRPGAAGFSVSVGLAVCRSPRQLNCIDREALFRKMPRQVRPSPLVKIAQLAQLNGAYRLVKKNTRPRGQMREAFKNPNKPSFPGSMQSIATSRALPGQKRQPKNRFFRWTREALPGLAAEA